jgi:hypothetical protein
MAALIATTHAIISVASLRIVVLSCLRSFAHP